MDDAQRADGRRWWVGAAALTAAVLVAATAACGGDDDDTSTEPDDASVADPYGGDTEADGEGGTGTADATFEVVEFEFGDVTAPAGGTVEFVNSSGGGHTVTADDGAFDEGLADGETAVVEVPAEPGDYPYHCEIHPDMTGTLVAE